MSSQTNLLTETLQRSRRAFLFVGLFSLAINLLLLTTSIYLMQIFDRVIASGSMSTLVHLTLMAATALIVLAILETVRIRLLGRISAWLEQRLAPAALRRTLDDVVTRTDNTGAALMDLAAIRGFLGGSVLSFFDAPWVPIYLGVIYLLHPLLGHVALAGAVILFVLAICNDRLTRAPLEGAELSSRRAMRVAGAALRNAEVVDALGLADGVVRRWDRESREVLRFQALSGDRAASIQGLSKFVRLFVQIAILAVGAWLVIGQQVTGGAMIAASLIMARALAPVEQAIGTWKQAVHAQQARRRLKSFFARPPRRPQTMPLAPPLGHLTVEGVVYGFEMAKPPILKGVSFEVRPGEAVAVMGPSAAGKSTLARLLVGVEQPSAGTVRLDGADVFAWRRAEVGKHLGYLPQDVELFSGSVSENIARLGEVDPERVAEAARLAGCHEMILRLDAGYQTELGDGGVRLSGGQRQRIALARSLYGNPRLVVLDEPNASLDTAGEAALSEAIAASKASGAAVVVMGHRPSTLSAVDKILVLIEGRVEGFGPREAMLVRMGRGSSPLIASINPAAGRGHKPLPSRSLQATEDAGADR